MLQRPPSSALFPYTALFRSGGDEFAVLVEDVRAEQDAIRVAEDIAALFVHPFPVAGRDHFVTASIGIALSDRADRKSTRLNSSHANISYAVFCLQKKQFALT